MIPHGGIVVATVLWAVLICLFTLRGTARRAVATAVATAAT
jgi:hypothetical protein